MLFKAVGFNEDFPESKEGIIKILSSGVYRGIGKRMAERIFNTFGLTSLDIVHSEPERLGEVKGIGVATVQSIVESVRESVDLRNLVNFIARHNISPRKIKVIQEAFPENPGKMIAAEPFLLCSISGFDFATVDMIAAREGVELDSPLRIRAGISQVLLNNGREGHLYIMMPDLLSRADYLLNQREIVVTVKEIDNEVQMMEMENLLVIVNNYEGNKIVYKRESYINECIIARRVVELQEALPDNRMILQEEQLDQEIDKAQRHFDIVLSPKQRMAVKVSLSKKLAIITGYPGTGKTTVLRFILWIHNRIVEANYSNDDEPDILLVAPTGVAARRMSESAGIQAYTIHKGLDINPETNEVGLQSMLHKYVGRVIADEFSMTDINVAAVMFEQMPETAHFTIIGDPDQLPSVGPGNVLADLIRSGVIPVVTLDVIYRQGKDSVIAKNAQRIRAGDTELDYVPSQFVFFPTKISQDDPNGDMYTQNRIVDLYLRAITRYGI